MFQRRTGGDFTLKSDHLLCLWKFNRLYAHFCLKEWKDGFEMDMRTSTMGFFLNLKPRYQKRPLPVWETRLRPSRSLFSYDCLCKKQKTLFYNSLFIFWDVEKQEVSLGVSLSQARDREETGLIHNNFPFQSRPTSCGLQRPHSHAGTCDILDFCCSDMMMIFFFHWLPFCIPANRKPQKMQHVTIIQYIVIKDISDHHYFH